MQHTVMYFLILVQANTHKHMPYKHAYMHISKKHNIVRNTLRPLRKRVQLLLLADSEHCSERFKTSACPIAHKQIAHTQEHEHTLTKQT